MAPVHKTSNHAKGIRNSMCLRCPICPQLQQNGKDYGDYRSFDGMDWARAFISCVRGNPVVALDEVMMAGWFSNALMRGYEESAARRRRDDPRISDHN